MVKNRKKLTVVNCRGMKLTMSHQARVITMMEVGTAVYGEGIWQGKMVVFETAEDSAQANHVMGLRRLGKKQVPQGNTRAAPIESQR